MKKVYITIMTVLSIFVLFNVRPIKSSAYEPKLPKGAKFSAYEENDQFVFRVVKPCTPGENGEVEIVGLKASYKRKLSKNSQVDLMISNFEEEPYEIVGIADYAFKNNKSIRSFDTTGAHLRYIGKGAFEGCTKLRSFNNNREDLTTIKAKAFAGCKSLCIFSFEGNNLKDMGKHAFKGTSSLIRIDVESTSLEYAKKLQKLFKKAGAKRVAFKSSSIK